MQFDFENLVERYSDLVFSVCLRLTGDYFEAQDLTQETFISAFTHYTDSIDNEKAWLCRIATNKSLDFLKKKKPTPTPDDDAAFTSVYDTSMGPEEDYIQNETENRLIYLCDRLKEPYRETAILHFVKDISIEEIAKRQNAPPATVRTRLHRARKMLKSLWKEDVYEPLNR